jgi:ribonuclease P protein subunit POP4
MRITPENIVRHELTGLPIHIVESTDPKLVCKNGVIIGESKNMIHFRANQRELRVSKNNSVFDMTLPNGDIVRINGSVLLGRTEDRMKKRLNRSW